MRLDKYGGCSPQVIARSGPPRRWLTKLCFGSLLLATSTPLGAQALGSLAADRARIGEITGDTAIAAALAPGFTSVLIGPDLRTVWNSDIAYSMNDGPMWAGRGMNASVTAGAAIGYRGEQLALAIVAAPTIAYSQNLPFDILPGRAPGRSAYSSPWHLSNGSADLPLRFGDRSLQSIDPGESSVTLSVKNVAFGASSTTQWWGPGIRNALIMSNNAGGIPRGFVRTARPIHTRVGDFTAELQAGTLTKSLYFDTLRTSDYRSFSGLLLTYRPPVSGVTLGLARAVYVPSTSAVPSPRAALNALRWTPPASATDRRPADQIASLFGRWIFPASGFEVYAEWARMELPRSLAEFLETPYNTEGYTLGSQWAIRREKAGHTVRFQSEISYLDQNIVFPDRPPVDFYTGRVAVQGYTERGRVIGAAIGPGGSSEWLAVDYLVPRWQLGVFAGRTRWEDNALYRQQFATYFGHDVSIYSGVRAGYRLPLIDVEGDLTIARRLNYLFQSGYVNPTFDRTVRVQNITFTTRLTPR